MNNNLTHAKVLFVEDEEQIRVFAVDAISIVTQQVVMAENGKVGLEYFCEALKEGNQPFDIIITDLRMPMMDGKTMIEEIRKLDQKTPIIILSADNDLASNDERARLNIGGYILKPMNMMGLMNMISDLLDTKK